jgi:hypothetical protein
MQAKQIFEYAVIRVMPRVERGEFLNVGVVLFCKRCKFLDLMIELNEEKLKAIFGDVDTEDVRRHLDSFEKICRGDVSGGPIAQLDQPSRFRWLSAKRSTIIQASDIHPGLTDDPSATLGKLFSEMVC